MGRKLRRTWKTFALAAFVAAYLVPNGLDVQIDRQNEGIHSHRDIHFFRAALGLSVAHLVGGCRAGMSFSTSGAAATGSSLSNRALSGRNAYFCRSCSFRSAKIGMAKKCA